MDFFVDFGIALQFIFWKLMKKLLLVLGPPFRDRKSMETRETQVKSNSKSGCSIKPVNHIRPQLTRLCPNSSWTPTSQNADGTAPYWDFNAMKHIIFIFEPHMSYYYFSLLTHWGRVMHSCIRKLTIIGSDNGLLRLNRCLNFVNLTRRNKLQWNHIRNL